HPAPDRDDEPGLLRNRDEQVRWNDAPAGAAPAEKRLDTGDRLGSQVEGRLVDEEELLPLDRLPEIHLEPEMVLAVRVHARLEQDVAVAAGLLRAVERRIGVA